MEQGGGRDRVDTALAMGSRHIANASLQRLPGGNGYHHPLHQRFFGLPFLTATGYFNRVEADFS
jgi:hypothetical protein